MASLVMAFGYMALLVIIGFFWLDDWTKDPFYSKNERLVNWVGISLGTQMFQHFIGGIIGYIVAPAIYRDRMIRSSRTIEQLVKQQRTREILEGIWNFLTNLIMAFEVVWSIIGFMWIGNHDLLSPWFFAFSVVTLNLMLLLSATPLIILLLSSIFCYKIIPAYYGCTSKKTGYKMKGIDAIGFMKDVGSLAVYFGPLRIKERLDEHCAVQEIQPDVKATTELTSYGLEGTGDVDLEVKIMEGEAKN